MCGSSILLLKVEGLSKNLKNDLLLRPACHPLELQMQAFRSSARCPGPVGPQQRGTFKGYRRLDQLLFSPSY
jgi:hypothetical protein